MKKIVDMEIKKFPVGTVAREIVVGRIFAIDREVHAERIRFGTYRVLTPLKKKRTFDVFHIYLSDNLSLKKEKNSLGDKK